MPNGNIDPKRDYVADLNRDNKNAWPTIAAARADAAEVQRLLSKHLDEWISDDFEIVVFGSLARREWTSGSDVDWTMLIDGQASPNHREHARDVKTSIEKIIYKGKNLNRPGVEGIFGNMAFSHEIVHHIGGQADTNRNTTQRILLLLEATAVADAEGDSGGPFERTVRQVLYRYLHSDSNFHSQGDNESRIPRFLLNDIVRFWRTMCVDFAYKDWEQAGKKWAVRNVKLRTSRKLLFMSGLLAVFSCFKNEDLRRGEVSDEEYLLVLQGHMLSFVHSTPLDIVLWTLGQLGLQERRIAILDQYEKFLSIMNDESAREHLGSLSEENVYKDDTFLECRHISHELQSALSGVCFEEESELRDFTIEYGVF